MVIGLLRRDDGWPTPQSTLAQVTTLLARSLRGDDWLARSGPAEFVVVLTGPATGAHTAAERLVAAVEALGIPGLTAAAGVAPLTADLTAGEVLRRATLSLTAARRVGAGTVIRYREPVLRRLRPPRRSTAAAIRSSVAVSARRTCCAPAGP